MIRHHDGGVGMEQRAAAFWERHASGYDEASAFVERRWMSRARAWVVERAVGETLEVCIGTGANLPLYPNSVRLTGLDWSPGMLAEARAKAAELGRRADFRQGDAAELPFPDNTFDSVVCTFGLCCVPRYERAIAEMARVLQPDGRLLLADHVPSTRMPIRLAQRVIESVSSRLVGEHFTRRPAALLPAYGLSIVDTRRESAGIFEVVHATH
ncbi:MAG: methyltransferase domain-containing protein [Actinobacteria bacterium]|nr:methyltransferase domain-containing protein [Actinomycetota bacterium]